MNVEKFKHIKKIFKETIKNPFYVPSFQNSNYPSRIVEMRKRKLKRSVIVKSRQWEMLIPNPSNFLMELSYESVSKIIRQSLTPKITSRNRNSIQYNFLTFPRG